MTIPDFEIKPLGPLSKIALKKGFNQFTQLCLYVADLPYGRNANRTDFSLVLLEGKGTCSSKHAFLHALAIENNQSDWQLIIGIYQMNQANTPGVGDVLDKYNLAYIPEAHCYLKNQGDRYDFTKAGSNISAVEAVLFEEHQIRPEQVSTDKVQIHQAFLKSWLSTQEGWPEFEETWRIREACISALSD